MLIRSLRLDGFLSFAPGSEPFELRPLNVLIGPNGSGKSNVIEALGLLAALPTDLAGAVRRGGGVREWIWKGTPEATSAVIEVLVWAAGRLAGLDMRHHLTLGSDGSRLEVLEEVITEAQSSERLQGLGYLYYFLQGSGTITALVKDGKRIARTEPGETLETNQSIIAQRKDPHQYPEVTWLSNAYSNIRTYSEWVFGSRSPVRRPQGTDLPTDMLLPDASNLALVLNEIEHAGNHSINDLLKRFFPLFERLSIRLWGGSASIYLFETGAGLPTPATRLSDGMLRFLALLAALYSPSPPSVLCIEEPELGLHPDAVALLADVLVAVSNRTQLVITTHSDSLVSALTSHGDSIVKCERLGTGTVLNRVDPDELASWLGDYTLGDLWRMGVMGANP